MNKNQERLQLSTDELHCEPGNGRTPTTYSTEASQIGFPPGYWPKRLEVKAAAEVWTMELQSVNEEKGVYVLPMCPVRLVIFND